MHRSWLVGRRPWHRGGAWMHDRAAREREQNRRRAA
uniref:Uncharacterized protein n=1 Tax=Arundo donax TaxID=35708 RepID=A0A0A9EW73_ARUDO